MGMPVYRVQTEQIVDKYVGRHRAEYGELLKWLRTAVQQLFCSMKLSSCLSLAAKRAPRLESAKLRWLSFGKRSIDGSRLNCFVFATNLPEKLARHCCRGSSSS